MTLTAAIDLGTTTARVGLFDDSMERLTDWYRRRTRLVMAIYGLFVAVGLNVSAVHVAEALYENEDVREYRVYVDGPSTFYWFIYRARPDVFDSMKGEFDSIVVSLTFD